ncbi:hypothetical protein ACFL2Q_03830 [Thermodesulfobacteriota bacterium]
MKTIQSGDQVVTLSPDGESIEVYTVVKALPDGVQVEGTSGKLSKGELRVFTEEAVNAIREKENQLKAIKQEMRSMFDDLDSVE